jgi:hypothetical protein
LGDYKKEKGYKSKFDDEVQRDNSIHLLEALKVPIGHQDPAKNEQEAGVRRSGMVVDLRKQLVERNKDYCSYNKKC